MKLYIPGGPPALEAPRGYSSRPITSTSWEGETTVTGIPSTDNPATLTPVEPPEVPGSAKQIGPLWSLPDGTKDTYNGETGVLVRRVGRLVLDGTSNIGKAAIGINTYRIADAPTAPAAVPADDSVANIYCDRMVSISVDTAKVTDSYGISIASNSQASLADGVIRFSLPTSVASTVAAKAWLSAHPLTIYYPMAYPTVERIIYTGPIATRATDLLVPSWTGRTTVTGTPSPDSPAAITGVPFAATATGPDGQSRSVDLGITGYSLAGGVVDSYDGRTGALVRRVARIILGDTSAYITPNRDDSAIDNVCIYLGIGNGYIPTPKNVTAISTHFVNRNVYSGGGEGIFPANSKPPYYVAVYLLKSRLKAYGLVDGDKDSYLIAANAWFKAQADAGTPVVVCYELEQPIAYNRKADITAFEGQTTVTGTDSVEVLDGRLPQPDDVLPWTWQDEEMLINVDFRQPVNSRGKTKYDATAAFLRCLDCWKCAGMDVTLKDGYVNIKSVAGTATYPRMMQQRDKQLLAGYPYTLAILARVNSVANAVLRFCDTANGRIGDNKGLTLHKTDGFQVLSTQIIPESTIDGFGVEVLVSNIAGSNIDIDIVGWSLVPGVEQQVARKVGDQWAQNTRSDPALKLLRCQRYYISQIGTLCNGYITGAEAQVFVPTPVTMRANPIAEIVFADNIVSPDGVWNVLAITNTVAYKNGVKLNITTNRPSNSARTVCTTASSSFSFSAEL